MKTKPNVGDIVYLNDYGLDIIGDIRNVKAVQQCQKMTITYVNDISMTEPEKTWPIEVDQQEINKFMIDNWCVDLVVGSQDTLKFAFNNKDMSNAY